MQKTSLRKWLRENRRQIERDLAGSSWHRYISAATYAQYRVAIPLMRRYVRGETIDLGCGESPFQPFLTESVTAYHTLDLFSPPGKVTHVGDIQDMSMIPDGRYDSAICLQVLEHVPDPHKAMREAYRILKPGGVMVVSVPHLSRLHDEPLDYYRFTMYGVRQLYERAGFGVVEIQRKAGLFSFLGHQVSSVILSAMWPLPGLRWVAWFLNAAFLLYPCYGLDRLLCRSDVLALGYVAVGQKPAVAGQGATVVSSEVTVAGKKPESAICA